MKVTDVYVPQNVLAGHPPIRLADIVRVYPNGACVTLGLRTIVWQSLDFVLRAMNVPREVYLSWVRREVEVTEEPCVPCCMVFDDLALHTSEKH